MKQADLVIKMQKIYTNGTFFKALWQSGTE